MIVLVCQLVGVVIFLGVAIVALAHRRSVRRIGRSEPRLGWIGIWISSWIGIGRYGISIPVWLRGCVIRILIGLLLIGAGIVARLLVTLVTLIGMRVVMRRSGAPSGLLMSVGVLGHTVSGPSTLGVIVGMSLIV